MFHFNSYAKQKLLQKQRKTKNSTNMILYIIWVSAQKILPEIASDAGKMTLLVLAVCLILSSSGGHQCRIVALEEKEHEGWAGSSRGRLLFYSCLVV